MINKAIIEGRLAQAIELRTTPQGKSVANFRVTTERQWNGTDGTPFSATDWHSVVAWEGLAEQCKGLHIHSTPGLFLPPGIYHKDDLLLNGPSSQ